MTNSETLVPDKYYKVKGSVLIEYRELKRLNLREEVEHGCQLCAEDAPAPHAPVPFRPQHRWVSDWVQVIPDDR